jgi:hypothetical protein
MSGSPASAYDCIVLGYRGTETDCFVDTLTSSSGDVVVADASAYDFRLGALSPASPRYYRCALLPSRRINARLAQMFAYRR